MTNSENANKIRGKSLPPGPEILLLDDAVLIRLEKPERMTASKRLWIPESAKRQDYEMYQGTVLRVGPGKLRKKDGKRVPVEVQVGDRVLFYWAAGEMDITPFFDTDRELRIIGEQSIQCVIGVL